MSWLSVRVRFSDSTWNAIVSAEKVQMQGKPGERMRYWLEAGGNAASEANSTASILRPIASYLSQNFTNEGSFMGRKWQNLSRMTQDVRETRGYDAAHPILVQSGVLSHTVIGTLVDMAVGKKVVSVKADGVNMTASVLPGHFTATISGPKVENQFGGFMAGSLGLQDWVQGGDLPDALPTRYGAGTLPQRPFFYLSGPMMETALQVYINRVFSNWQYADLRSKVTGLNSPDFPTGRSVPVPRIWRVVSRGKKKGK